LAFVYQAAPTRVVFAPGSVARLEGEAERLNLERVLLLSTVRQVRHGELAASALGARLAGTFAGAAMHTPVEVTNEAFDLVRKTRPDRLVAIGGGSAIGLAKALALRTDLPQIVVPTTYAVSEATPILGETKDGLKTTQRSERVLQPGSYRSARVGLNRNRFFACAEQQMEESMSDETIATAHSARDLIPVIARMLLSVPFIWAGYLKLVAAATYQAYFAHLGLPLPVVVWSVAIVIEIGGGLALLLGIQARVAGSILAAWCIATALVAHTDFSNPDMQVHFMKNVAMAGGFLYVAAFGAGGHYTIQQAFGRRRRATC
jgi:uncharacterized membrane protein YphA (DoxX/SURF4 family)